VESGQNSRQLDPARARWIGAICGALKNRPGVEHRPRYHLQLQWYCGTKLGRGEGNSFSASSQLKSLYFWLAAWRRCISPASAAERAAQRLGSVLSREEASVDPNSWAFSYHVRAKSTLAT
jgi:hypothetical protein